MSLWTYVAQIVNFLLFLAILYKLLYRPLERVMAERRAAEQEDRRKAEEAREEARQMQEKAEAERRSVEESRDGILAEARKDAEQQRQRILDAAEDEARERIEKARQRIDRDRDEALGQVQDRLRDVVLVSLQQVLAQQDSGQDALAQIKAQIDELSERDVQATRKDLTKDQRTAHVRTARDLSEQEQKDLRDRLRRKLDLKDLELEVERDDALLSGIEVTAGPLRIESHWRAAVEAVLSEQLAAQEKSRG